MFAVNLQSANAFLNQSVFMGSISLFTANGTHVFMGSISLFTANDTHENYFTGAQHSSWALVHVWHGNCSIPKRSTSYVETCKCGALFLTEIAFPACLAT